jgi:hypothetical protein
MYNLPEGATFMVPVTAYEMSKATVTEMAGGGGGLGDMSDLVAAITQLANSLQTTSPQELPLTQGMNLNEAKPGEGFTFGGNDYKMFGPSASESRVWSAGNPLPVMVTNMAEGFKADILGTTNKPYDERGAAIQEAIPTPAVPLVQQNLNPVQPEFWTLIGNVLKTFWEQGVQPIFQGQNQTAVPPTTVVPEIKLPAQMMNWFSQQSLMTTPVSATNALQVPDQKSISTALNLSVDSKIVLTVDGRTLATIIKPYLYEDLIRFGSGTTSSTSRSVIA